ncbi:MAG: radical SAM/SPASM domain-containing protein [Candidatus Muiribacteriota bacterium]
MWMEKFLDNYILVELTDYCNYNCIMCCHDRPEGPHTSKKGFMDKNLFIKIINELPHMKAACGLKLFWLGEPFLNPVFPEMFEECCKILKQDKGNYYIDLHTNAAFLTPEISELLIKNSDIVPRITLSLDAFSQQTYSKIRRGGNLHNVVENIEYFLKLRAKYNKSRPGLIFQFIVMEENKHEAGDFGKFWIEKVNKYKNTSSGKIMEKLTQISGYSLGKKIGNTLKLEDTADVVWYKRLDTSAEKLADAEKCYVETMKKFNLSSKIENNVEIIVSEFNLWNPEQQQKKSEEKKENRRRACSGPWKTPAIKWDGTLTICCFDPSMELQIGNLNNNTFSELWFGDKINSIRKNHLNGDFDKVLTKDGYQKCLYCPGLDTPFLSDEEIKNYERN